MPSLPPHILTIPRELRDKIYQHLRQTISFELRFRFNRKTHVSMDANLDSAPLLSVLLTCSRFRDEYREATCFKNLTMTVVWEDFALIRRRQNTQGKGRNYDNGLKMVYGLTVFSSVEGGSDLWQMLDKFVTRMKSKSPKLPYIRVACREVVRHIHSDFFLAMQNPRVALTSQEVWGLPPLFLAGLPVCQVGEGFHHTYWRGENWPSIYNSLRQLGVYVYDREMNLRNMLSVEDINQKWPPRKYPHKLLNHLPTDIAEECRELHLKVWGWQEKRGEEVKTWEGMLDAVRSQFIESSHNIVEDNFCCLELE